MPYTSRSQKIELFPTMHDRSSIDFGDPAQDSLLKLLFGFHTDLPQERVRHLTEKRFHQIEPGTVLRRVDITKAIRPCCQVSACLLGGVRRMIIQNHPNL